MCSKNSTLLASENKRKSVFLVFRTDQYDAKRREVFRNKTFYMFVVWNTLQKDMRVLKKFLCVERSGDIPLGF